MYFLSACIFLSFLLTLVYNIWYCKGPWCEKSLGMIDIIGVYLVVFAHTITFLAAQYKYDSSMDDYRINMTIVTIALFVIIVALTSVKFYIESVWFLDWIVFGLAIAFVLTLLSIDLFLFANKKQIKVFYFPFLFILVLFICGALLRFF